MSISQAERLIWKIQRALASNSPGPSMGKLADEYARFCQAAGQRLEQCVAMVESGSDLQALLLAETPPSLPDLLAILAFKDSVRWRGFCEQHGLPIPDRLPDRAVSQLNSLYSKQITPNHALYAQYRSARTLRQPEKALETLRLILKLNPADTNAQGEAERLEALVLDTQLKEVQRHLEANDETGVVAATQRIATLGLTAKIPEALLPELARIHSRQSLAHAESALEAADWQLARSELDEIARRQSAHPFVFSADDQDRLGRVASVVSREEELFETERSFGLALQQLDRALGDARDLLEQRAADRTEMSAQATELNRAWRQVEQFARSVPDGLDVQCAKTLRALRSGQESVRRSRRNVLVALTALVLLAGMIVGGSVLTRRTINDYAASLSKAQSGREVETTRKLLGRIEQRYGTSALPNALQPAVASSQAFLQREGALRAEFDRALAELSNAAKSHFIHAPLDFYLTRLKEVEALVANLAPDFIPAAGAQLSPVQEAWNSFQIARREERNTQFEQNLSRLEKQAAREFRYDQGTVDPASLSHALSALVKATNAVPGFEIRPDLLTKFAALIERTARFTRDLDLWKSAQDALAQPASAQGHIEALRIIAASPFASIELAAAARSALELDLSPAGFLGPLLLPGNPAAWRRFETNSELRLWPSTLIGLERVILEKIQKDPHVLGVTAWRYAPKIPGSTPPPPHVIFLKGDLGVNKFARRLGSIHDPLLNPDTVRFMQAELDPPNDCLLEVIGPTPEAQLYDKSGASQLLAGNGQPSLSMLQILDLINRDASASPLFKAWLSLQLHQVTALQPESWGLPWAPAAGQDHQKLLTLGAEGIQSGDWFNSALQTQHSAKFEQFFSVARSVSYLSQARLHHQLCTAAAWPSVKFRGYTQLGGRLKLASNTPQLLIFLSAPTRQPALGTPRDAENAVPLTPLFSFERDRRELLLSTAKALGLSIQTFQDFLPPLYSSLL